MEEELDEDDAHAELGYTVPRAGEYVIQVSTAAPGQTGTLRADRPLRPLSPIVLPS